MVQKLQTTSTRFGEWLIGLPVILLAFGVSILAWYISYTSGLSLAYNDAMSHINIARLVVDNQEPGLSQIGSVWLPLNHILPVIFVWNDTLWRTGLAATIFSMISYVIATVAVYKTVLVLTRKKIAAVMGAIALAANVNMLYLQTTPLTEPLYVALFSMSVLFFTLYIVRKNAIKYLLFLGFTGFLQVSTRYDGWFVVGVLGLLIAANELFVLRHTLKQAFGKLLLYGVPVAFGIFLWLAWNAIIFGDALFFAVGPYSAKAQQETIQRSAELITKGDLVHSTLAYFYAMRENIGSIALGLGALGALLFVFLKNVHTKASERILILVLLASPIVFNILALFLGFSILNLPELNWNPSGSPEGYWFNVRYGILALPFVAVLIGLFAGWRRLAMLIAVEVLILQSYMFTTGEVITVTDGTKGSSAYRNAPIARELSEIVAPNETVLMSVSFFNPVAFDSGLQLRQFVHEGVSKKWKKALENPAVYAQWIVMSSTNDGEPVRKALLVKKNETFLNYYEEVYSDNEATVYRLKDNTTVSYTR